MFFFLMYWWLLEHSLHFFSMAWKLCVHILVISDAINLCVLQVYYVYGFMLLVFLILIIVTICVTIVGTYFLLNAENYHWQWTSFFSAASTAVYVYLYSVYYYFVKTKMSGFFQTSFYFGYTLMFSLGLGILCGEFWNIYISYILFVNKIIQTFFTCSFQISIFSHDFSGGIPSISLIL